MVVKGWQTECSKHFYANHNIEIMEKMLRYFLTIVIIILLLSGCEQAQITVLPSATVIPSSPKPTQTDTETPEQPTLTPTPQLPTITPAPTATLMPKSLVVCSEPPPALNPFINSQATQDLLSFISVLPAEKVHYTWEPHLITHIPDFGEGDVITRNVSVENGAYYADTRDFVSVYFGAKPLVLPQMIVTFTLKSGLKWSDGQPLTTDDVVFGYSIAQKIKSNGVWHHIVERTSQLSIIDEHHIRWEGIPGYLTTDYAGVLFPPQPKHKWHDLNLLEILQDLSPPGTGPYRIVDKGEDKSITLEVNPHYEGLKPEIEKVIFHFPEVQSVFWPEMVRVGLCDILLPGNVNDHDYSTWIRFVNEGNAVIWHTPSETLLRLDFNTSSTNRRTIPLRTSRTRFGLAHCVSREHLQELSLGQLLEPAYSFIPNLHPAYDPSAIWRVPFNNEVGQGILNEIGWRDENNDGIREAHDVEGIRDNTPLTLTLSTSTNNFDAAQIIADDLDSCGVGIIIDAKGPQQLFAASSVSPLFAGDFELALYTWQSKIPEGCNTWMSSHIPNTDQTVHEFNYGGYNNPLFDEVCQKAVDSVDLVTQIKELSAIQKILSEEQPTVFLTWQPRWLLSHSQIKNINIDESTFGRIYQPEAIAFESQTP